MLDDKGRDEAINEPRPQKLAAGDDAATRTSSLRSCTRRHARTPWSQSPLLHPPAVPLLLLRLFLLAVWVGSTMLKIKRDVRSRIERCKRVAENCWTSEGLSKWVENEKSMCERKGRRVRDRGCRPVRPKEIYIWSYSRQKIIEINKCVVNAEKEK